MDLFAGANQVAGIDLLPPSTAFTRQHESVNFPSLLSRNHSSSGENRFGFITGICSTQPRDIAC